MMSLFSSEMSDNSKIIGSACNLKSLCQIIQSLINSNKKEWRKLSNDGPIQFEEGWSIRFGFFVLMSYQLLRII